MTEARLQEVPLGSVGRLFELMLDDKVKVRIGKRFPLAEAAEAHRAIESRATTGSTVLIP